MFPIIALWAHPRSMSTAIERIMRSRGDCRCFHEPFMYDYYVHRQVRRMPHFDLDPDHPVCYTAIRAQLLAAAERETLFLKDMSYYVVPAMFEDLEFARHITHAFLIRDPRAAIQSYFNLDPALTLEEVGLEAQWRHFTWITEELGQDPPVLQAEAVRRDPQGQIGALWRRVGLPPAPEAFAWQSQETPKDWGQVAGWHGKASASRGIEPPSSAEDERRRQAFEAALETAPHLRDFLNHHQPFHDRLRRHAVDVETP